MLKHSSWLLLTAACSTYAAVIQPGKFAQLSKSDTTCACTHTVTQYVADLKARQEPCPAPVTVTATFIQTDYVAQELATVVQDDPSSISSWFSSVAAIDSIVIENSSQDRPIGQPADTGSIYITRTASAPAIIASDDPNDSTVLYRVIGSTSAAVSTTVEVYPPAGPVVPPVVLPDESFSDPDNDGVVTYTATITTYASTVVETVRGTVTPPSNLSVVPKLHKRQTCSMIFAQIDGRWASWCNNWDGTSVVSFSTYETTELVTHPLGLPSPIPESVYNPALSLSVSPVTYSGGEPTSTSTPSVLPAPASEATSTTVPATLPGVHPSASKPTSTSRPATLPGVQSSATKPTSTSVPATLPGLQSTSTSQISIQPPYTNGTLTSSGGNSPAVISKTIVTNITMTVPITTLTTVIPDASATSSSSPCGQVGQFSIGFDDLPSYSTSNPNETASPPIFDPYTHMYWSSGYGYGPPPTTPYEPHDGSRLALYDPLDAVEAPTARTEGRYLPGSFGAGPRVSNNICWFDAKSAYVGCNNTDSSASCQVTATGYRWSLGRSSNGIILPNEGAGQEVLAHTQQYTIPATCAEQPCPLTQILFDPARFSGLSTLNFVAKLGDTEVGFYLDTFEAVWTNGTCDAGIQRASSRK